jgi:hypothetical protein
MDRQPAKPKADMSREERLAKALRENLRRRKANAPKAEARSTDQDEPASGE